MHTIETPNTGVNSIKIIDKLYTKIQAIWRKYKTRYYNDMVAFSRKLEKRFGARECRQYKAFHWLIGSTPLSSCEQKDFPGNEVKNFITGCEVVYPVIDAVSKRVNIILTKNPIHANIRRPAA